MTTLRNVPQRTDSGARWGIPVLLAAAWMAAGAPNPARAAVKVGTCCGTNGCEEEIYIGDGTWCCNGICQFWHFTGPSCDQIVTCIQNDQCVTRTKVCCSSISGYDCNDNDVHDDCELEGNDCNSNGQPDDCDADCQPNGVPDDCEVVPGFEYTDESPQFNGFVFSNNPPVHVVTDAPPSVDTVSLSFDAVADLDDVDGAEFVRVLLKGCPVECDINGDGNLDCDASGVWCQVGRAYEDPGEESDCPATPASDTVAVDPDIFNALLTANGGNLEIRMEASVSVTDDCGPSYIKVTTQYPTATDCDVNDAPDECDIRDCTDAVSCGDCDGDGVQNQCESDSEADCDGDVVCNAEEIDEDDGGLCTGAECSADCNGNGIPDECDIMDGTSQDCNANAIPDECDNADCTDLTICGDCDEDGLLNECEADGGEQDCDANGLCDACDIDCAAFGGMCNVTGCGAQPDCQLDGSPDVCDIDQDDGGLCTGAECSADCNGNGIPDECDIDENDGGLCTGMGCSLDCNGDGEPNECEASVADRDCDENGLCNGCEIDCGVTGGPCDLPGCGQQTDCQANGIPDDCDFEGVFAVETAGARYIKVTPAGITVDPLNPTAIYRLLLFPEDQGCQPEYIQTDGLVGGIPGELTIEGWCSTHVFGSIVIPDSNYAVVAEDVDTLEWYVLGDADTCLWGDTNCNGYLNVLDVSCAVDVFKGIMSETCNFYTVDEEPPSSGGACAAPNQLINVLDISVTVDAFKGFTYPCPEPCFGGFAAMAANPVADLEVVGSAASIPKGAEVEMTVYIRNVPDLRGYQVGLSASGGSTGTLSLVDAFVDSALDPFAGATSYAATSGDGTVVANLLDAGGVDATQDVYMATFRFQASSNACGQFTVSVNLADVELMDSYSAPIGVNSTTSASVQVGARCGFPGQDYD